MMTTFHHYNGLKDGQLKFFYLFSNIENKPLIFIVTFQAADISNNKAQVSLFV